MKCSNCGREIYSGSNCPFCGGTSFSFDSMGSQGSNSSLGFGSAPFGQNNFGSSGFNGSFGQNFYPPSPQKNPKNNLLIIAICSILALSLLTFIIILAIGGDGSEEVTHHYTAYSTEPAYTYEYTSSYEHTTAESQTTISATSKTEPIITTEPVPVTPALSDIIPFFELRYFLNALSREDLEIICALYEGLMNLEKKIVLPHTVSLERFAILIEILHYECPELFQYDFASVYSYYTDNNQNVKSVELPYAFSQSQYLSMRRQCEGVINSFMSATYGLSDTDKEKYVYDWFGANCHYNSEKAGAGNPYNAFINGYAKCDGFSLATKWAMESMGIQCLCIGADNIYGGIGHAWNIINIGGNFYLLDTTFGVPTADTVKTGIDFQTYSGFNTADTWSKESYVVKSAFSDIAPVPACNITTDSYYAQRGGLVRSGENPVNVIVSLLDDLQSGNIDKIELQFENSADYNAFTQNSNERISEALDIYGASWRNIRTFSHDYYAFTVFVNFN